MIIEIITLYAALYIVLILHELGHFPEKIKVNWGLIPSASAMRSKYRFGGLVVNIILFLTVSMLQPEMLLLQLVGLVAWAHFIIYLVVGSLIPEMSVRMVDVKTHVFDDVPNEYNFFFITLAIITLVSLQKYYLPILQGVFI